MVLSAALRGEPGAVEEIEFVAQAIVLEAERLDLIGHAQSWKIWADWFSLPAGKRARPRAQIRDPRL
jgi:hypothetical protein